MDNVPLARQATGNEKTIECGELLFIGGEGTPLVALAIAYKADASTVYRDSLAG